MPRDARLAIVVSPASSDLRGEQGGLDGDAFKERLMLADAGFEIVQLDGASDVAEQLDTLFDARGDAERGVLFYASTDVRVAGEEFFLCLDPGSPDTGDSLADVAAVLCDRVSGPLVFVLDTRYTGSDDPTYGADVVGVARKALKTLGEDVEMIIGARPTTGREGLACSPFTRAILEVLDESDPRTGLTAQAVYEALSARDALLTAVRAFAHLPANESFVLVNAEDLQISVETEAEVEEPPESITNVVEKADAAVTPTEPEFELPPGTPIEPPAPSVLAQSTPTVIVSAAAEPPPQTPDKPPTTDAIADPALTEPKPPSSFFPPSSQPDALTLIEEARRLTRDRDLEGALGIYRKTLGLGNLSKDVRGHVYLRMGTIKASQAKSAEAIAHFEKALTLVTEEDSYRVLDELLRLYMTERDFRAALATQEKILKGLPTDAARFEALLRFGVEWLAIPAERLRARQMLERAERLDPDHRDLLVHLKDLGEVEGRVEEVLGLRKRIAAATTNAEERSQLESELARDLAKRGREDEAVKLYESALDAHPSRLDPLVAVAEILSEKQEWSQLESAYIRMLERLPRVEPASMRANVEWELSRRMGLLMRDHMDDMVGALAAFSRGARARPGDVTIKKLAADAARSAGDADALEEHLLALTRLEPNEPRIYRMLLDQFIKTGAVERASHAAFVLISLGSANDRERVVYESNRPDGVPKAGAPFDAETWRAVRHHDTDLGPVERIFEASAPAVAATLAEIVATTQASRLPDPRHKVDVESSTVSAARALAFASRALGLEAPAIYLDERAEGTYSVLIADPPASRVGSGALRGRSLPELMFMAGRHLTYHAPIHRMLALCPAIEDLSACFLSVVLLVNGDVKAPPAVQRVINEMAPRIETWLGADELGLLREAVGEFTELGGRADLLRYIASVERTSLRVGLLVADDLAIASKLSDEGLFLGGYRDVLTPAERRTELFAFAVSREFAELRAAIHPDAD